MGQHLFTSESVTEGHPDKIADQISDGVLDAVLTDDPLGRVACETLITTGQVMVAGEISTSTYVDIPSIVRATIRRIGYTRAKYGFDAETCGVSVALDEQSPDIAQGVNTAYEKRAGGARRRLRPAGRRRPGPDVRLRHRRDARADAAADHAGPPHLRAPGGDAPQRRSATCAPTASRRSRCATWTACRPRSSRWSSPPSTRRRSATTSCGTTSSARSCGRCSRSFSLWHDDITFFINPTGIFVVGGPLGDCGLTGRKIIVDTYGGMARHGGGAFSGKDPSKVDRSAAYAARWVAKNVVAAGFAKRAEVQVAYAIGVARPVSVSLETYGTETRPLESIEAWISENFDLRPGAIVEKLDLRRPIYQKTAAYGHFGRPDPDFTWESTAIGQEAGGQLAATACRRGTPGGAPRAAAAERVAPAQVLPLVAARSLDRILDYAVPAGAGGRRAARGDGGLPARARGACSAWSWAATHRATQGRLVPLAGVVETARRCPAELLDLAGLDGALLPGPGRPPACGWCCRPAAAGALRRDAAGEWILAPPPGRPRRAPDRAARATPPPDGLTARRRAVAEALARGRRRASPPPSSAAARAPRCRRCGRWTRGRRADRAPSERGEDALAADGRRAPRRRTAARA